MYTEWKEHKLNFIDTPGADDFVGGVISALNVVDTGVMVINAVRGIEVGTEIISRHAKRLNKPLIFVINQVDHEKANFDHAVEQAKAAFGSKVVLVQYPVNPGIGFNRVIDVLKMEMYQWKPEGGKPDVLPIPKEEEEKANELHNALIEAAAENDEGLMELFFDKGSLTEDEMRAGIRKGLIARDMFPGFLRVGRKRYVRAPFHGVRDQRGSQCRLHATFHYGRRGRSSVRRERPDFFIYVQHDS